MNFIVTKEAIDRNDSLKEVNFMNCNPQQVFQGIKRDITAGLSRRKSSNSKDIGEIFGSFL